jgi:hypothetical protein
MRALDEPPADEDDHVELWRRHNSAAAFSYLEDLERRYETGPR